MKKILFAALAFACSATSVSAEPLMKYTYLDASYQWTHVDADGVNDSNGVDTKISYNVVDHFALEGGYNYANSGLQGLSSNIDQSTFRYGGVFYNTFCNDYDLLARVGGSHVQLDNGIADGSDNGVYAGLGLRTLLSETLEGNLDATYDSVNSIYNVQGGTWTYTATALQALSDDLALKLSAGIDADSDVFLTAGLRLTM